MVRIDFRVNFDDGGTPLSWDLTVTGIGKNNTVYFYLDGVYVYNDKGNNYGDMIEQGHTIPVENRAKYVNAGGFTLTLAPGSGDIATYVADGVVFLFRRESL